MSPPAPSPALGTAARGLAASAAEARRLAAGLAFAAARGGWRSTAARACEVRLIDLGRDLLVAAALLDEAADTVTDHAATAARRADELERAARAVVAAGLAGPLGAVLT